MIEKLLERKRQLTSNLDKMYTKEHDKLLTKLDKFNELIERLERLKQQVENLHTMTSLSALEKVSSMNAENDLHETVDYAKEMVKIEESLVPLTEYERLWNFIIKQENFIYFQLVGKLEKAYKDDRRSSVDHYDYRNLSLKVIRTDATITSKIISILFISNEHLIILNELYNIEIWDVDKNQCIDSIECHFFQSCFNRNISTTCNNHLLAVSTNNSIIIWKDYANPMYIFCLDKTVTCIAFSHTANYLASGFSERTIIIWDMESLDNRFELHGHNMSITCSEWSPNDSILISGSVDKTIRVWNIADGDGQCINVLVGHTDGITALRIVGSRKNILYSAAHDKTWRTWNIDTGNCLEARNLEGSFDQILLNSDENIMITLQIFSFKFYVWDILSKKVINVIECPFCESLYGISVSPNGAMIAATGETAIPIWIANVI
jgi:WD40 repeat protein